MDTRRQNLTVAVAHLGGQTTTASLLGVSQPTVFNCVHSVTQPSRDNLRFLAELCGVHPSVIEYGDLEAALRGEPAEAPALPSRDASPPRALLGSWDMKHPFGPHRPIISGSTPCAVAGASIFPASKGEAGPVLWSAKAWSKPVARHGESPDLQSAMGDAEAALFEIEGPIEEVEIPQAQYDWYAEAIRSRPLDLVGLVAERDDGLSLFDWKPDRSDEG